MDYDSIYRSYADAVESELDRMLPETAVPEGRIYKAMRYSLLSGGKRVRPVLSLAVCDMLDADVADVIGFACAVEMIHAYSLIHDDLPAMDNSDYRRGKPSCHMVFGEALAILAGDALLNKAFEVMTEMISCMDCNQSFDGRKRGSMAGAVDAMALVAGASGTRGMIGGQVIDISGISDLCDLDYLHGMKTGAMFKAAILAPAVIIGADSLQLSALTGYAKNIGLAFQIKDDILDVEGDFNVTGKSKGTDAQNFRDTYISLYGIVKSKQILSDLLNKALSSIEPFGEKAVFLKTLTLHIAGRCS